MSKRAASAEPSRPTRTSRAAEPVAGRGKRSPGGVRALRGLRARDVMQRDLLVISPDASIREAVEMLEEYHVGGAPVVDAAGRLVGSLSVRDVARSEHVSAGRIEPARAGYATAGLEDELTGEEPWELEDALGGEGYGPAAGGEELVRDWMSPAPVSVRPDASLKAICDAFLREGVHRVLVVEDGKLVGLVSTTDVVRCVAETL